MNGPNPYSLELMRSRSLCLILIVAAATAEVHAATAKPRPPAKKAAAVKPPPAPPKGKTLTFPKQKHRRPAGKIIKIFPGDKHLDPKSLASAPSANQVAAKQRDTAVVKLPKKGPSPKRPGPARKP